MANTYEGVKSIEGPRSWCNKRLKRGVSSFFEDSTGRRAGSLIGDCETAKTEVTRRYLYFYRYHLNLCS
jgi:hypothetical protein